MALRPPDVGALSRARRWREGALDRATADAGGGWEGYDCDVPEALRLPMLVLY